MRGLPWLGSSAPSNPSILFPWKSWGNGSGYPKRVTSEKLETLVKSERKGEKKKKENWTQKKKNEGGVEGEERSVDRDKKKQIPMKILKQIVKRVISEALIGKGETPEQHPKWSLC